MSARGWAMLLSGAAIGIALGLWLLSGRQGLTKRELSVTVEVRDELVGDIVTREEFQRGPIFGYYVGLDAVGLTAAAGVLASGLTWALTRERRAIGTAARRQG
jgi:hypothetical protein